MNGAARAPGKRREETNLGLDSAPGPTLYAAEARTKHLPYVPPPKDGAYLKDRFRRALIGASATAS